MHEAAKRAVEKIGAGGDGSDGAAPASGETADALAAGSSVEGEAP
jgi:hypothetical protein